MEGARHEREGFRVKARGVRRDLKRRAQFDDEGRLRVIPHVGPSNLVPFSEPVLACQDAVLLAFYCHYSCQNLAEIAGILS